MCPHFFQKVISPWKKGVWKSEISWLFLIHYKLLENQKIGFFTVFWGDVQGVYTLCPPCTQATFKRPAPLGLNGISLFMDMSKIKQVNFGTPCIFWTMYVWDQSMWRNLSNHLVIFEIHQNIIIHTSKLYLFSPSS